MGGWPDLQEETQDAEKPEARPHGGWEHQQARHVVLPDEDGAQLYQTVSPLGEQSAYPTVLVVPMPEEKEGPPLQGAS